jgi:hypothetical protein
LRLGRIVLTRKDAIMSAPRCIGFSLLLLSVAGCDAESPARVEPIRDLLEIGACFEAQATGTVRGRVVWQGPIPDVASFEYRPKLESPSAEREAFPNTNALAVDAESRGVANAVVFLREVDRKRSRPWDHAGVFVELMGKTLRLEQGNESVRTAFARRGEPLTINSTDSQLHVLRAGGAAFYSLTFMEPHKPRQRRLDQKGLVELTSAVGHFWQHGYVFVDDHPYYARTDSQGRFVLPRVPEGDYRLVCWIPNWKVKEQERDTESGLVRFLTFAPALELEQTVNVLPGSEPTVQFLVEQKLFSP